MPAGTSGKGRGTATKHAERLVLHRNPEEQQFVEAALADRVDDSPAHLQSKLNGFLTHVVQENYPWLLGLEAIEDIEDIEDIEAQIKYEDIEDMIFEKILDWSQNPRDNASYSHSDLKLHNRLWGIVNTDKDGTRREHDFVIWCKRIAEHRTESIAANNAATEHADIAANNAATEHAGPFRTLVKDIWANELTPSQRKKSKYKLYEYSSISTGLRSVVNAILRKNLGDARVAAYILEHGVPTLLDPPWIRRTLPRTEMDSMLEKFLEWHASLLKWLGNRQNDPNTIVARKLSDLKEKKWQAERRRKKSDIEQQLRQGACLANLRDSHAKRFHDMSATEQRVLEDYETGKLRKRLDAVRIRKPNQQAPKGPA